MDLTGRLKGLLKDWGTGKWTISFEIDESPNDEMNNLAAFEFLDIKVDKHREIRSVNANKLMWACIGQIAAETRIDKWDIYKQMLRRYGKFVYLGIPREAVEDLKKAWRECEEIGVMDDGKVEMLCYFGSSTYNSKDFSVLLDGIIDEMKEMGLALPRREEVDKAIEGLRKREERKSNVPR